MSYVLPSQSDLVPHATQPGSIILLDSPAVHPGAMHDNMPRYYTLPDQRRIKRVPRPPHLSPLYETVSPITFSAHGWPGVRVKDILRNTVVIDFPNDTVFEPFGWRSTVIQLEWPGYESGPAGRRVDVRPDGRYLGRQDFAREICIHLFNFRQRIAGHPRTPGWEEWAFSTDSEGIRVTDVVLFSVHYYRNVWVPEFYVIERENSSRRQPF